MSGRSLVLYQTLGNSIQISKWKVKEGTIVSAGRVLLLYTVHATPSRAELQKLKASAVGTVRKLLVREGDVVQPGDALLELERCTHPTVMKDMCAECGADLRNEDVGGNELTASIPMVHSIPELKVSAEQAQILGKADEERLLANHKLVLLVDLDQTLIHTTNDNIPANLKDVYHFRLHGSLSPWHHTRLRPGTKSFLKSMSQLYELHICTFGSRMYAHMIANFLDPDGQYFSHRILSRDECFSANSKTANLKALFPCGDNMVCIIDDREDVWNFAPNLIHVKPYHFFQHTGDINAPPGLAKQENDDEGDYDFNCLGGGGKKGFLDPGKNGKTLPDSLLDYTTSGSETLIHSENVDEALDLVKNKIIKTDSDLDVLAEEDKQETRESSSSIQSTENIISGSTENLQETLPAVVQNDADSVGDKNLHIEGEGQDVILASVVLDANLHGNHPESTTEGDGGSNVGSVDMVANTDPSETIETPNTCVVTETVEEKLDQCIEEVNSNTSSYSESKEVVENVSVGIQPGREYTTNLAAACGESSFQDEEENESNKKDVKEGEHKSNKRDVKEGENESNKKDVKEGENESNKKDVKEGENESNKKDVKEGENESNKKDVKEGENESNKKDVKEGENESNKKDVKEGENESNKKNEKEGENELYKMDVKEEENESIKKNEKEEKNESNRKDEKDSLETVEVLESNKKAKEIEVEDHDDYLMYLEDILKKIHCEFYQRVDNGERPDLKEVVPAVKKKVLAGTSLVFSGLVPNNIPLERSRAYQVAVSLGASVTQDLHKNTTHLVAVRPKTAKVNSARHMKGLYMVTADWLWTCAERWEHVDEKVFPLGRNRAGTRHPPAHCGSPEHTQSEPTSSTGRSRTASGRFMDTINPLLSFSSADIADMDQEVNDIFNESESDGEGVSGDVEKHAVVRELEAVSEGDSQEDVLSLALKNNPEDTDSSSSSADSLSGEHPHGWSKHNLKRKQRVCTLGTGTATDSDGDDETDDMPSTKFRRGEGLPSDLDLGDNESESQGSEEPPDEMDDGDWNMMGAALEREFLS